MWEIETDHPSSATVTISLGVTHIDNDERVGSRRRSFFAAITSRHVEGSNFAQSRIYRTIMSEAAVQPASVVQSSPTTGPFHFDSSRSVLLYGTNQSQLNLFGWFPTLRRVGNQGFVASERQGSLY